MATLDPTTPAGRLLMFRKHILPGRIQTAEFHNETGPCDCDCNQKVEEARAEIRRLERQLHPAAAARADAGLPSPSRFKR